MRHGLCLQTYLGIHHFGCRERLAKGDGELLRRLEAVLFNLVAIVKEWCESWSIGSYVDREVYEIVIYVCIIVKDS